MRDSVIYCRRSTAKSSTRDSQENSLTVQETILTDFAKAHGSQVAKVFLEEASGTLDSRPVFADALQYCIDHDALLLVYRLDRLSRSYSFYSKINNHLHRLRIAQLGWKEPDEFICSILLAVSANESRTLSARVKATHRVLKSRDPNYRVGNPNIETTATPAGRAVRIQNANNFNLKIKGLLRELQICGYETLASKASRLNAIGVMTRRGRAWTASSVHRVENYKLVV